MNRQKHNTQSCSKANLSIKPLSSSKKVLRCAFAACALTSSTNGTTSGASTTASCTSVPYRYTTTNAASLLLSSLHVENENKKQRGETNEFYLNRIRGGSLGAGAGVAASDGGGNGDEDDGDSSDDKSNNDNDVTLKSAKEKSGKQKVEVKDEEDKGNVNSNNNVTEEEREEQIEATKLSFSAINQAIEKKRRLKKKKKNRNKSSSGNTSTSANKHSKGDYGSNIHSTTSSSTISNSDASSSPKQSHKSTSADDDNDTGGINNFQSHLDHFKNKTNTINESIKKTYHQKKNQYYSSKPPTSTNTSTPTNAKTNFDQSATSQSKEEQKIKSQTATDTNSSIIEQILSKSDYYEILGIHSNKQATQNEITKAYRKRTLITHPDKCNGEREAFDKVREAYDVLNDVQKRQLYDKFGKEAIDDPDFMMHRSNRMNMNSSSSFLQEQVMKHFFGASSFSSPFSSSSSSHHIKKNRDVTYKLQVSLEDLYNGISQDIEIQLPSSSSSSSSSYKSFSQTATTSKTIHLDLPRGTQFKQSIRLSGEVDTIQSATPGDVIFQLQPLQHKVFTRKHHDLAMELEISFKEAICGFDREIVHLDGRKIRISNPCFKKNNGSSSSSNSSSNDSSKSSHSCDDDCYNTFQQHYQQRQAQQQKQHRQQQDSSYINNMIQSGDVHVLKGEGMPKYAWAEKKKTQIDTIDMDINEKDNEVNKQYGDLYIQYKVGTPIAGSGKESALTEDERKQLGELLDKLQGVQQHQPPPSSIPPSPLSSSNQWKRRNDKDQQPICRLQVSSASEFGKASQSHNDHHHDDDEYLHTDDHDHNTLDDDYPYFGRAGGRYNSHTTGTNGRGGRGAHNPFFTRGTGFGNAFGTNHDDHEGDVQCHQM